MFWDVILWLERWGLDKIFNFKTLTLSTLILLVTLVYLYGRYQEAYFRKRGIKTLPIDFPIVAHMYNLFVSKEHIVEIVNRFYQAFPDQKYVGFWQVTNPLIMIRDLEILKQIGIKYFDQFLNRKIGLSEEVDEIFGGHLFALKGEKWRDMRSTLSPAYTSSKMKGMFQFITETGKQVADFYLKKMEEPSNKAQGMIEVDMKNAATQITNDIIATSAFGLRTNTLQETTNEFYENTTKLSDFKGFENYKFLLMANFPQVCKLLGIKFKAKVMKFFRTLVLSTMKTREENNIVRHDMIKLLMDAKKGNLKHEKTKLEDNVVENNFAAVEESEIGKMISKRAWNDDEIVAQAMIFLVAGFETVSTVLTFMSHELVLNPEVQKRLLKEVDEIAAEKGSDIDYNDLVRMKYMDMVVSETLRRWPPLGAVDRECMSPFQLPPASDGDSKGYKIQKGEGIWIPIYALHHDPQHFPNPYKFDPERFSDENKHKIKPMSYIPFGVGPRNCIGSRFALMETKAIMYHLLLNFEMVKTINTTPDINIIKDNFFLSNVGGTWIGMKPRSIKI